MLRFTEKNDALFFTVRVAPRASKSEIAGEHDGALKVRVASPPVDGAANAELVRLLAKTFGVARSDVEIVGGQTAKTKQIKIFGLMRDDFLRVLNNM